MFCSSGSSWEVKSFAQGPRDVHLCWHTWGLSHLCVHWATTTPQDGMSQKIICWGFHFPNWPKQQFFSHDAPLSLAAAAVFPFSPKFFFEFLVRHFESLLLQWGEITGTLFDSGCHSDSSFWSSIDDAVLLWLVLVSNSE